jgi:hypothetical protein
MKRLVKLTCLLALMLPVQMLAQKDSIRLVCPLNDATVVPPPKNALKYNEPDLCVVLVSIPDTIVKAVYNGKITNVEFDEESLNGIVMYAKINNKDYYFWYTGMNKVLVHRNDVVKAGQALGYISPGHKIELLMYQFETPVDPIKYLDCKGIPKTE